MKVDLIWCTSCKASVRGDASFCGQCGKQISHAGAKEGTCCKIRYRVIGRETAYCARCGSLISFLDNDSNLARLRVRLEP